MRLFRRPVQRYCSECGGRMRRVQALIYRAEYDQRTGKRAWVWYWGCPDGFRGWNRLFLDGSEYHDAKRIATNAVRRRLVGR